MKRILLFVVALFVSLMSFSQNDTILLDECVVSFYRANKTTPITFKNIDKTELDLKCIGQEPSFILSQTPSITGYSDAGSGVGYSYFRLRGIDQTRINMTFDGVPLNESEDQGVYFNNYPDFLNSVSSIQIQRGIGTSSNGVASYGGSINFESPQLFGDKKYEAGFDMGSYHNRVYAEYNSGKKNNHGLYIRLSNVMSDGYKLSSWNKSKSLLFSYGYMKNNHVLKLTGFVGHQRNAMAWLGVPLDELNPTTNTNTIEEDDNFLQSLIKLQHNYYISDKSKLSSTIYYNYLNGNYDFDINNFNYHEMGYPNNDSIYLFNYHLIQHFVGAFTNYSYTNKNFRLVSGLHINSFNRTHIGSDYIDISTQLYKLYSNIGTKNEISGFAKIEYDINKFTLYADVNLRKTKFNYTDLYKDPDYENFIDILYTDGELNDPEKWVAMNNNNVNIYDFIFITPHLGLNYKIKNSSLYTNIGYTQREPSRLDLFGGMDFYSDYNNTYLRNEQIHDLELGYRYNKENFNVNINLYYMYFKDGLVFSKFGTSGIVTCENQTFDRKGAEIDITYKYDKFTFTNNSSFTPKSKMNYNEYDDYGDIVGTKNGHLTLNPFGIINQSVTYEYRDFIFGLDFRYQSRSYIDYEEENYIEEYYLFNAMINYKIYKNLDVTLRLNNITNQTYYSHGYITFSGEARYFIQAPFNFNLSIKWTL
jgi:iron complex outermembrane recepter protein